MKRYFRLFKLLFLILLLIPLTASLSAQEAGTENGSRKNGALKVYLDCYNCDMNYTREQIPYVNYVREGKNAEVYVLVSTQNAGNGGTQYTYTFLGQGRYSGMNDTLVYTCPPNEASSVIRSKRTDLLEMGLVRYVAKTPMKDMIQITHNMDVDTEEVEDRWNNWIFELRTSPRLNFEQSYSRINIYNSLNVSRVTPEMKLEIEVDQSWTKQSYKDDDGNVTTFIQDQKALENLFVKSLGDHFSAGLKTDLLSSTNTNYNLGFKIMPAVEYDLYPYSEATHRQLRFLYSVGYLNCNYIDSTIYNKTRESLFEQELRVGYEVQDVWGSVNISLTASNFFHDWSKNKVELDGFVNLTIVRGLSISVNGGVAYINNQLNLRKEGLSEAERLLRLKEQATNFNLMGSVSISYTFGSIYNNVVNPRFGYRGGIGGF